MSQAVKHCKGCGGRLGPYKNKYCSARCRNREKEQTRPKLNARLRAEDQAVIRQRARDEGVTLAEFIRRQTVEMPTQRELAKRELANLVTAKSITRRSG